MKKSKTATTEQLVDVVVNAIQEVKGEGIKAINLKDVTHAVSDYFIVCNGNSHTQVQAIARSVEEEAEKQLNDTPWHKEGVQNADWILLDFSNVVVHIFHKDAREFYNLEELWADGEVKEYEYSA